MNRNRGSKALVRHWARTELGMLLFFLACWLLFCLHGLSGYPLAGAIRLNLFHLFGLAASGGWLLGNLEVNRERRLERTAPDPLPRSTRRRLFFLNLLAPAGVLFLIWSLAPDALRLAAPMAPIYAAGIFVLFFLVPVSLKRVFAPK